MEAQLRVELQVTAERMTHMLALRGEEITASIRHRIAGLDIPKMIDSYAESYLRVAVEQQVRSAIDTVVSEQLQRFMPDIRDFVQHALAKQVQDNTGDPT